VSFSRRGLAGVVKVDGELTRVTGAEFATRAAAALAAFRGPVLFDLSGLDFIDTQGARTLTALLRADPARASLYGCSPVMRRVLQATGYDLPPEPALPPAAGSAGSTRASPPPPVTGWRSRGETMTALTRATRADARRSGADVSAVMSRLAATYARIALSSRYRLPRKDADRRRLLALSRQAGDLARKYQRHSAADAG
jgi:anti-anti-sigma regulatory factor